MTEQLYRTDAYLKEVKAIVTHITETGVILDKTIFYPKGGGQPDDKGVIIYENKEYIVDGFEKKELGVVHKVEKGLSIGDKVMLKIDWDYRYSLMRHHTTLHLLSAVVNKQYNNTKVTGGNIYNNKARLDFDLPEFKKDMAQNVVDGINRIIQIDHDISVSFMDRSEAEKIPELFRTTVKLPDTIKEIRIVKIGDIDIQADGGLHVNNTREIGEVKLIKTENKGKGRKRVTISVN